MKSARAKHQIRAIFNSGTGGYGNRESAFGHVEAFHKRNGEFSPYCVANEFVCAELAHFLRLPIPPFGITRGGNQQVYFSSLNFNFANEQLPPILPDLAWTKLPQTCTGVLLFDILIANNDRHDENLVVDRVTDPTDISMFDHEQALFGGGARTHGVQRLNELRDNLGISGGEMSQGNRHCLLDVFDNTLYVDHWIERIASIPAWFIRDVCSNCRTIGVTSNEVDAAVDFLIYRSQHIPHIISSNSAAFTLVSKWPWEGRLFL